MPLPLLDASLFADIPVDDIHKIVFFRKVSSQMVCQNHRAMVAPRTPEGDVEPRLSLPFMKGNDKRHQFEQFGNKNLGLLGFKDVIPDTGIITVKGPQFLDLMWIGDETDVQNHVGIGRQAIAIAE